MDEKQKWPWGEVKNFGPWLKKERAELGPGGVSQMELASLLVHRLLFEFALLDEIVKLEQADIAEVERRAQLRQLIGPLADHPGIVEMVTSSDGPQSASLDQHDFYLKEVARWRTRIAAFEVGKTRPNAVLAECFMAIFRSLKANRDEPDSSDAARSKEIHRLAGMARIRQAGVVPSKNSVDIESFDSTVPVSARLLDSFPFMGLLATICADDDLEVYHEFYRGEIIVFLLKPYATEWEGQLSLVRNGAGRLRYAVPRMYGNEERLEKPYAIEPIENAEEFEIIGVAVYRDFVLTPFSRGDDPFYIPAERLGVGSV